MKISYQQSIDHIILMLDSSIFNHFFIISLIKSNIKTIIFFHHLISNTSILSEANLFEQGYVQEELNRHKEISLKELPLTTFPSGCEYFLKLHNLFYDEIDSILYN